MTKETMFQFITQYQEFIASCSKEELAHLATMSEVDVAYVLELAGQGEVGKGEEYMSVAMDEGLFSTSYLEGAKELMKQRLTDMEGSSSVYGMLLTDEQLLKNDDYSYIVVGLSKTEGPKLKRIYETISGEEPTLGDVIWLRESQTVEVLDRRCESFLAQQETKEMAKQSTREKTFGQKRIGPAKN